MSSLPIRIILLRTLSMRDKGTMNERCTRMNYSAGSFSIIDFMVIRVTIVFCSSKWIFR